MTVTAKTLIESHYAGVGNVVEYTVPQDTTTIIDKFTATNTDGSARTITVNLTPNGVATSGANAITSAFSISAGASVELTELKNHILSAGDLINVIASIANKVVIRASGREIT